MNAEEILKISENQPERLFPNSEEDAKNLFRTLVKEWHPDVSKDPQAQKVVTHVQKLYDLVVDKIKEGTWTSPNSIVLIGSDKKERIIKFLRKRSFEIGEMYYGDRVLCYVVKPEASDLFSRAMETIKHSFKYKDKKMQDEVEKYLPVVLDNFETKTKEKVLVLAKTPDVFLLQDVIDFYKGSIDPKHVAWIMNCFYNISCYFRYSGLSHNAISTTTCFISPKHHSGMIYGGWWYSQMIGKNLIAIPGYSAKIASSDMMKDKIADSKLDLNLIRQMGLDCLGDPTGINILHDGKTPKSMVKYLRGTSSGDALKDYRYWSDTVLVESFGKRRFVEMNIESSDIYME